MATNDNTEKWKVTDKRYVAFIDIMGFKDMVARKTHNEIYKMMQKIDESKKFNESVNWAKVQERLVTSTTYSDSIMIYSKDNTQDSLDSFICTVAGLTDDLFIEGIPHKGAFAFGTMTLDKERSIFFGQPLIDAYLLQEEINFYGIVGHASAELEIDKNNKKGFFPSFLSDYLCPFKTGSSNHLVIHPINAEILSDGNTKGAEKLMTSVKKLRYHTSGSIRKYIDNTEAYLKAIKGNT